MTNVSLSTRLPASARQVWDLIGGFGALAKWHPLVEKCEIEEDEEAGTTIRRLSLVGGGAIVEKLETVDEDAHVYSYTILESPLPVADYRATIRVSDAPEGGATVEWSSTFEAAGAEPKDAAAAIEGVYKAGFDQLRKMFGG